MNGVNLPVLAAGSTNGSRLQSNLFSATAGEALEFYFNYVSSDGSGFADYAWARLLDSGGNEVALLFTARTTPAGNAVPGFGVPLPTATLTPSPVAIIPGGPVWSPLGSDSGACFNVGCGYTGWILSQYTIAAAGNYRLEFGTANWQDQLFESGLAFDGLTIGGVPIPPAPGRASPSRRRWRCSASASPPRRAVVSASRLHAQPREAATRTAASCLPGPILPRSPVDSYPPDEVGRLGPVPANLSWKDGPSTRFGMT